MGRLLEQYRNYLTLVARSMIGAVLKVKLDPSDLVQETFLKAHQDFPCFAGSGDRELLAWLRKILTRSLADQIKHHRRKGRDHHRQRSLDLLAIRSGRSIQSAIAVRGPSPSAQASERERALLLANAVDRLSPLHREVFLLRTIEHLPFQEIAPRMGRTEGAVRMLWARTLERLNRMLENHE